MLPEEKSAHPKLLCLDTNKWIDLAKAHYGKPGGERFRPALEAVQNGIANGRLVVAGSIVNTIEAAINGDLGRRTRLVGFISQIASNRWIVPAHTVLEWELVNAVRSFLTQPPLPIRPRLIGPGVGVALGASIQVSGGTPEEHDAIIRFLDTSEVVADAMLALGDDRERVAASRRSDETALTRLEEIRGRARRDLSSDQRYMANFWPMVGDPRMCGTPLEDLLRVAGVPPDYAVQWLSTDGWRARHQCALPSLYSTLVLEEFCPANRRIDQNDVRDQFWLSSALPYANAIVMERFWAGVIQRSKLDKHYGTTVLTDAADLPSLLAGWGC